jgi:glucose-1-phosphate thymidylyltransferase
MKGVILAGGSGKRLSPLTDYTSKLLLPVGKEPMLWHSIRQCYLAGIQEILIITSANIVGQIAKSVGSGHKFGCSITFRVQEYPRGIADALLLAEEYTGEENFIVLLADNIFEYSLHPYIQEYKRQKKGARILLKSVADPQRFGVANIEGSRVTSIVEKPQTPSSHYVVVGCYMYDKKVYELIRSVKVSSRGEMEITDVNNQYIIKGELAFSELVGNWIDAGTFSSLNEANLFLLKNNNIILKQ